MDLSRGRTSADRSDAARRRLELIGAQLAADPPHENAPYEHAPYENAPYEPGAPDHRPEPGRHRAPTLARRQRWSGEVHDRLPGRWQSLLGRGLTAQHIVVVLAVVAGFVCLAAWWVISARPSEIAPLGAPSSAVSAAPAPASTS
ncbi:MAG: hypothetical protein ACRDO8_11540, partial [Nocardioidaceae bacterium]